MSAGRPGGEHCGAGTHVLVYVGQDRVGDGLIKLPFVQALRQAYPSATLTWFAGRGPSAFLSSLAPLASGLLDQIVDHDGTQPRNAWQRHPIFRSGRIDVLIDTQRGVLTSLALRQKCPGLFVSGAAGFRLSNARPSGDYIRPRALLAQLLDLLELATGEPPAALPRPRLCPVMVDLAARLLPAGPCYLALAPGAGGQHKAWPIERFLAVARQQVAAGRVPVWILGPDELHMFENLSRAMPSARFPLQDLIAVACGFRPDLTIALATRCALGLGNDSGGGHMLAAAGVPLVRLFGPTDPEKFAPTNRCSKVIRAQYWGKTEMTGIPVSAVIEALERAVLGAPAHYSLCERTSRAYSPLRSSSSA